HAADQMTSEELLDACLAAGADALVMPEHSFDEQLELAVMARAVGLEQVLFLYLEQDLKLLAETKLHAPVIYLQSADLQTGGPFDAVKANERLGEVRESLGGREAFVLVGFGIRGAEEAATLVNSSADGVIIGTALTEAAVRGPGAVADLVHSMAEVVCSRAESADA
ncbi:MAG: tryptophan synthase subunit alpha, partial [Actinomycetota bacterium]|nr:tryptophan synthase subunit alpha [Actinomycetota bacterium]